jgi:DNA polymerase-3 subunit alpha
VLFRSYRPSPLKNGMDDLYCKNRTKVKSGEKVVYHSMPVINDILKDTYGTFVFQEQVMEVIHQAAGLSYAVADEFRKIMAKNQIASAVKDASALKFLDMFREGCAKNGFEEKQIEDLWNTIAKYNEYTFNRPHSVEYAMISYWMAYLKCHYFKAFILSMFNSADKDLDKIKRFVLMAAHHKVLIKLPFINEAMEGFSYDREGKLIWGFGNVKGLSSNLIQEIIEKRPFTSLDDMFYKIGSKKILDRRSVRALYKAGAFEKFKPESIKFTYNRMYGAGEFEKEFNGDYLEMEKEAFGIYVTFHPMRAFKEELKDARLISYMDGASFNSAQLWSGVIEDVQMKVAKKSKKQFCVLVLEDYNYGRTELLMMSDALEKHMPKIKIGSVIKFKASKSRTGLWFDGKASIFMNLSHPEIRTLNETTDKVTTA